MGALTAMPDLLLRNIGQPGFGRPLLSHRRPSWLPTGPPSPWSGRRSAMPGNPHAGLAGQFGHGRVERQYGDELLRHRREAAHPRIVSWSRLYCSGTRAALLSHFRPAWTPPSPASWITRAMRPHSKSTSTANGLWQFRPGLKCRVCPVHCVAYLKSRDWLLTFLGIDDLL